MPNICNTCGEFKLCRQKEIEINTIGISFFEWRCKDCDDYENYSSNQDLKRNKIKLEKEKKAFVKKRDLLLEKIRSKKDE